MKDCSRAMERAPKCAEVARMHPGMLAGPLCVGGHHPDNLGVPRYILIWTHWDLNPGPSACEADVMPLHHVPLEDG